MIGLPFLNRTVAGLALAGELTQYERRPHTIILALVRGGVVIGRALSEELLLPLFPYIVRKIGFPGQREFAVGAIAQGGAAYVDETTLNAYSVSKEDLEPIMAQEKAELSRRLKEYAVRPLPSLQGKTAIVTDDGAATGATLFATIEDLRRARVHRIVVALPVCPPDTKEELAKRADEVVVLAAPANFIAVGMWYLEFPQVEDEEVIVLLH